MFAKTNTINQLQFNKISQIGETIDYILNTRLPNELKPGLNGNFISEIVQEEFGKMGISTIKGFIIDGYYIDTHVHVSVHNILGHGLPNDIPFEEGQIVRVDLVGKKNNLFCDAARSFIIGNDIHDLKKIIFHAETALQLVIDNVRVGDKLSKIGKLIENYIKAKNLYVVHSAAGHGIGEKLHENPCVINYYDKEYDNYIIYDGTILCVEPIITDINVTKNEIYTDENFIMFSKNKHVNLAHVENTLYWSNSNKGKAISLTGSLQNII